MECASGIGVSAVLMQRGRPLALESRKLAGKLEILIPDSGMAVLFSYLIMFGTLLGRNSSADDSQSDIDKAKYLSDTNSGNPPIKQGRKSALVIQRRQWKDCSSIDKSYSRDNMMIFPKSSGSNSFTGPLLEEFVCIPNLEYLNLGGSYFNGTIPTNYRSFLKLKSLYLNGNSLTGQIPAKLGYLNQLQHKELGNNVYSGGFPVQLASLSNLIYLDISSANLSGDLSVELGNLK
ncbi:leucine-rich repeat receptor-like protein kinase TDR [Abeliophyllum distichum]|uniref:Leucine-rich repeat receptor-like protein kinase TDR n=1 Tax=Abeliophyllum distichum TaxID=126358 RepID=A0ABD1QKD9_9LAMI